MAGFSNSLLRKFRLFVFYTSKIVCLFFFSPNSITFSFVFFRPVSLKVKVTKSCPTLCDPMDYTVHGILQARILEWVAFPFSRGSSQPRSPALQVNSLWAEPQGKPRNTGVGSLSLLQQIFPTQESNWGLLHCRQIVYQLSYQGSPNLWA